MPPWRTLKRRQESKLELDEEASHFVVAALADGGWNLEWITLTAINLQSHS
jgi:hypothetical protein